MRALIALLASALGAEVRLPELVYQAPAALPAEAPELGEEPSLLLRLQISEQGEVLDALVVEPTGTSLDEAALIAAFSSRFTPAYDAEGQPSGAVIDYRVVFDASAEPVQVQGQGLEVLVEEERLSPEIGERRLSAEDIRYLPGSAGDVVKVVQSLPGVARAPLGTANLSIRGTAPEDSATYLDGSPIPLVFHFAGLTSVVPGEALDEVAFVPGSASVRYGRLLGGVVDLRTTSELPEASNGQVSVDLYQASMFVEQRLGERTAITLAGRRSYIDAVLSPLLSNPDTGLKVQAPRYYDAQLRVVHQGDASWDLLVFGSDDRFRFLGAEEDEVFASFADRFLRARVRRVQDRSGLAHETTVSLGPELRFFELGEGTEAYERDLGASLRDEWSLAPTAARPVGFRAGVDVLGGQQAFLFDVGPTREEGESLYFAPGAYAEGTLRLGRFAATPGLRGDALVMDNGYSALSLDPRLSLRWAVTDRTVLRAAIGRYSAFPTLRQVDPGADGELDLLPERSLQTTLGVQHELVDGLSIELAGYLSELDDLVVGREERLRFFNGPPPVGPFDTDPYANDGVGRSLGAELLVRYDGRSSTALLAATWSRSRRIDRPGEDAELFESDQPLVLSALWSQKLPRDLRLGARLRAGSGNPYTPVVQRYFDTDSRSFVPVYGERSSARLDPFFSLDVRVDKSWTFQRWSLGAYLEIQNATNARNPELMAWNTDYSKEIPITSNPTLPVFGLRGQW